MPQEVLNLDIKPPKWLRSEAGRKDGVLKNTTSTVQSLTRPMYDDTSAKFRDRKEQHYYALEFDVPPAWEPCLTVGNGPTVFPTIYPPSNAQDVAQESLLQQRGNPYALKALGGRSGGTNYKTTCSNKSVLAGPLTPQFTFNDGRKTLNNDLDMNMKYFKPINDRTPFVHSHLYRQSVEEIIGEPNRNQTVSQLAIRQIHPLPTPQTSHYPLQSAYN